MRTTVEFESDTAKLVEQVRKERGRGVSDAVNELIRRAAVARRAGLLDSRSGQGSSRHPGPSSGYPRRAAGLVTDAVHVALCVEHGLEMVSADSDFARFPEIRWFNPLLG